MVTDGVLDINVNPHSEEYEEDEEDEYD